MIKVSKRKFQKLIDRVEKIKEIPEKIARYGLEFLDRYYSMYEGFVANNEDPEGRGRIKVSVPTLNLPDDEPLANWALPKFKQPVPGNGYGSFWVPPEGALVYVEFLQGDLNSPVWSGGFYGESERPDEFDDVQKRGKKTPGGHTVQFDDRDGEESILIQHVRDALMEMASDDSIRFESKNGDVVQIDPEGSIEVKHRNGATITLNDGSVEIENNSGSSLSMNGGQEVIEANQSLEIQSPITQVNSQNVRLGSGASSPVIKGDALLAYLSQISLWAQSHVHPVPISVPPPPSGPSTVPPPSIPPNLLSTTTFTA